MGEGVPVHNSGQRAVGHERQSVGQSPDAVSILGVLFPTSGGTATPVRGPEQGTALPCTWPYLGQVCALEPKAPLLAWSPLSESTPHRGKWKRRNTRLSVTNVCTSSSATCSVAGFVCVCVFFLLLLLILPV